MGEIISIYQEHIKVSVHCLTGRSPISHTVPVNQHCPVLPSDCGLMRRPVSAVSALDVCVSFVLAYA